VAMHAPHDVHRLHLRLLLGALVLAIALVLLVAGARPV
jgi:hypothetical protein